MYYLKCNYSAAARLLVKSARRKSSVSSRLRRTVDVDRVANAQNIIITAKELSECNIHLIGHIQGNSGNSLFAAFTPGGITATDTDINNPLGTLLSLFARQNDCYH
jgi:hypothetical protein